MAHNRLLLIAMNIRVVLQATKVYAPNPEAKTKAQKTIVRQPPSKRIVYPATCVSLRAKVISHANGVAQCVI